MTMVRVMLVVVTAVRGSNANGHCGGFDITDQTSGSTCMTDSGSPNGCYNLINPPNGGSSCWYTTAQSQCCGHGHCSSQYNPYFNNCICENGYSGASCDQAPPPPPTNCIGAWGSWNQCSATCGGGTQTRSFAISQYASNGGSECDASNGEVQSQQCGTGSCPPNPEPGPEPTPEPSSTCAETLHVGQPTEGAVLFAGAEATYCIDMIGGVTYQIEVALSTLSDSVVAVKDIATMTELASNDDAGGGLGSFLEWTSPTSATYQIVVTGYGSNTGTFTLTAEQIGGDPCAGGVSLVESQGDVLFSNAYDVGAQCLWTISCDANEHISLTFEQFATELNYDFVNVFDGSMTASPQLAHLSGAMNNLGDQTQIESTSSFMTLQFTSDGSVNGLGFEASWTCTTAFSECVSAVTPGSTIQGSIDEQGTDVRYCLDVDTTGESVLIEVVLDGSLQDSIVRVYSPGGEELAMNDDGGDGLGSVLEFSAPYPARFLIAVEGYNMNIGSYTLTVNPISGDPCISPGMAFTESSGDIFWIDTYSNSAECLWTITCGQGEVVVLTFVNFNTEHNYDWVNLLDGPSEADAQLAHLSGTMSDISSHLHTTSSDSAMTVEFTSDDSVQGTGFDASWVCTAPSSTDGETELCGANIAVGTPIVGEMFSQGVRYCLIADVGTTYGIELALGSLSDSIVTVYGVSGNLEFGTYLASDDDSGAGYGSYLEWTAPASGPFSIEVSGYGSASGTFTLTVVPNNDPCVEGLALSGLASGDIFFSDAYDNAADCIWTITCDAGAQVDLDITSFSTERNYDYLNIMDGTSQLSPQMRHLSGDMADIAGQTNFVSSNSDLTLEFTSDGSVTGQGFDVSWVCSGGGH